MPCEVELKPGTLQTLDLLGVDAMVLTLFDERAQPRGAAGLVDWRMCGRVARFIQERTFDGRQALLTPVGARFGAERLFLFGLGRPAGPAESEVRSRLGSCIEELDAAGARTLAVALPSVPRFVASNEGGLDVGFAEAWLDAMSTAARKFERMVLLDVSGHLTEAKDALLGHARDRGLSWSSDL